MGQKDIVEKNLEDYNDVFADIVNALVFKGKQAVRPRDLMPVKVRSQYKADEGKLHEEERDNASSFTSENPTGTVRGRFWRWWIFRKAWKIM